MRTALFLGYSRTDSDFLQIQSVIKSRLGRFQRRPYIVQFDASPEDIEFGLDNDLHIINISAEGGPDRSDLLADFFEAIQKEVDARAGKELRRSEPQAFENVQLSTLDRTYEARDAVDLLESSSTLCFVMMPFGRESESIYWNLIKPAAENVGLTPLRADQISTSGQIIEQIRAATRESRVCIADVSTANPNVLYELGLAEALGKPILLIAKTGSQPPFDIAGRRYIGYDEVSPGQAGDKISSSLSELLERNKLDEAQSLIENGLYRAAVASMGVILEHALRHRLPTVGFIRPMKMASTAQMADALRDAGVINNELKMEIKQFTDIRNRAVHELEEPSADNARLALQLLKHILQALGDE